MLLGTAIVRRQGILTGLGQVLRPIATFVGRSKVTAVGDDNRSVAAVSRVLHRGGWNAFTGNQLGYPSGDNIGRHIAGRPLDVHLASVLAFFLLIFNG